MQGAEEESAGEAASGHRAARGVSCRGTHLGQHVDMRGARETRCDAGKRTAQNNEVTAECGGDRTEELEKNTNSNCKQHSKANNRHTSKANNRQKSKANRSQQSKANKMLEMKIQQQAIY